MTKVRDHGVLLRAAAVGRLMLGEFESWGQFEAAANPKPLNRHLRRATKSVDRQNLGLEIEKFLRNNFDGMTINLLAKLYSEIEPPDGLRIDIDDFQKRFARLRPHVRPAPAHATVQISLWGLQFEFPEDHLSKDIQCALFYLDEQQSFLSSRDFTHTQAKSRVNQIGEHVRKRQYACRSCVLACFSLLECYLNGLSWDFARDSSLMQAFSEKRRAKLADRGVAFREKLLCYPKWLLNIDLEQQAPKDVKHILEVVKPLRDSIVHPSPFAKPDEFGGKSKLNRLYELNYGDARSSIEAVVAIIVACETTRAQGRELPPWLTDLTAFIGKTGNPGC